MSYSTMPLFKSLLHSAVVKLFFAILLILVTSLNSHAISLDELIADNKLTIETSIKQDQQQIVGQPLVINIEVATNRWFAKGTQIKGFELADTIILANSEISINGTKNIDGQTWSTQTREITLYPRRHGEYILASITVQISVNTENNGIVEGAIKTKPQHFTISLPKALANVEHFIVSPLVKLVVSTNNESNGDDGGEKNYAIGDAITQTITITAQDAPAMTIPPIQREEMLGLSIYQNTPQVFDKSNRGDLLGTRIESFTYIFEQAGKYEIPEQMIFWWDTNNNELQEIVIPSLTFNVGKSMVNSNTVANFSWFNLKQSFWIIVTFCLAIGAVLSLIRYKNNLVRLYANLTHLEKRIAKKDFLQAVSSHNYIGAIDYLYKYSLLIDINLEQLKSPQLLSLNKLVFDNNNEAKIFTVQDAKELLNDLTDNKNTVCSEFDITEKIKLNH